MFLPLLFIVMLDSVVFAIIYMMVIMRISNGND